MTQTDRNQSNNANNNGNIANVHVCKCIIINYVCIMVLS